MCGIVGFTNFKKKRDCDKSVLQEMTKALAKRGPDEESFYLSDNIHLGHRRLIIIDAQNGKQPMSRKYHDNTYTIVYNGQLYNAKDLRKELEEEFGYTFSRLFRYRSSFKSVYSLG